MTLKAAWLGLGVMGSPMAGHLQRKGDLTIARHDGLSVSGHTENGGGTNARRHEGNIVTERALTMASGSLGNEVIEDGILPAQPKTTGARDTGIPNGERNAVKSERKTIPDDLDGKLVIFIFVKFPFPGIINQQAVDSDSISAYYFSHTLGSPASRSGK